MPLVALAERTERRTGGGSCGRRKSCGRLCGSVEMMTQRPVTGSRRSSDNGRGLSLRSAVVRLLGHRLRAYGLRSTVHESTDFDLGFGYGGTDYSPTMKAPRTIVTDGRPSMTVTATTSNRHGRRADAMTRQPIRRHHRHAVTLGECQRVFRAAVTRGPACLDFDKHQRITVARHDVDFAGACAVAPGKNRVPLSPQFVAGEILAGFSKDAVLRQPHAASACNSRATLQSWPGHIGERGMAPALHRHRGRWEVVPGSW